ncbi:hypothetical protein AVEN_192052-1 [Araneus ventricosus]|uniref:Uncharacterized protein n=1 Tax=Araneus ventricosus TaxID=182803 RepID=A0A4Y2B9B2_ARAVE|nr:hypothetical protein AVEN_192052-1 [Araneus ventricosus]
MDTKRRLRPGLSKCGAQLETIFDSPDSQPTCIKAGSLKAAAGPFHHHGEDVEGEREGRPPSPAPPSPSTFFGKWPGHKSCEWANTCMECTKKIREWRVQCSDDGGSTPPS